jgi:type I restriction enzyme S subunit
LGKQTFAKYGNDLVMEINIKDGYKVTEVGVIPDDWEVKKLESVSTLSSGTTPSRQLQDRYFSKGTINWVKTTDLNNSNITQTEEKITELAIHETCLKEYDINTVLVAMYGGFNQIGRTGLLKIPATVNQALIAIQSKINILNPVFLINYLNFRVSYWKNVAISSRKDPNITSRDVKNFLVTLPPLAEQKAIAHALSDVDNLITAIDQLITKKRNIKQGTMQELLTGKKRLPGFSGKWEVKKLGDIGECIIGLTYKPENVKESGLLVLRSSNIADNQLKFDDTVFVDVEVTDKLMTKEGDILICVRNGSRQLIGKNALIDKKSEGLTFGAFMSVYRTKFYKYIFHAFQTNEIKKQIHENIGATINQITNKNLNSFEISLPPQIEEQKAIAEILTDIDKEIEALEKKRDKYKTIKQGMMQELLTGKTRIIDN